MLWIWPGLGHARSWAPQRQQACWNKTVGRRDLGPSSDVRTRTRSQPRCKRVCMRPTLRRMGDGSCRRVRRVRWGASTFEADSGLSWLMLKVGFGPCLPPSPHIGNQCRLPPPPLQSRFHHDLTDTINQYNTSLNEQHPVKTMLSINFRKTIVSAAVPHAKVSALRRDALLLPPACLLVCLSVPSSLPPNQETHLRPKQHFWTKRPPSPQPNPSRVLAAPPPRHH